MQDLRPKTKDQRLFKIFGLLSFVFCLTFSASEAFACSACFLKVDNAMTRGMNAGILSLLGILAIVLGSFLTFIFYLWRRSRKLNRTPLLTRDKRVAV
jgi:hypothetical protein